MTNPKDRRERALSPEAQAYADKVFRCEQPCDSFGICTGCFERTCFVAGYQHGHRAGWDQGAQAERERILARLRSKMDAFLFGDNAADWLERELAEGDAK